jgi:alpha-mannosidase
MKHCELKKIAYNVVFTFALISLSFVSINAKTIKKDKKVRGDTIHVIGHAHMDMDWLWTYAETSKMANDNLRQAVTFMKEYSDFTMLQSQAAVYNFVERTDPRLFAEIKKFVAEGRLEPVGGMWVEGDQNISSGEALSRSLLIGQRYFKSRFNRIARIGWLPDDFGHTSQLPQMLRLSGMNYYFFMRCAPYPGSFWWIGPDSSKILCYNEGNYNGTINEELKDKIKQFPGGKNRILSPTGVGDHGGGPTRENIEAVHKFDLRSDYPSVKFTTAESFYKKMENEMAGRPTHYGEMQFIFEGCYTNVAENKEYNRKCENILYESEFFNSLNWMKGNAYPSQQMSDIWKSVTFNQFHDILPGSAIYESNRESVSRYMEAFRQARELRDNAFLTFVDNIPYVKGNGQPVVAFNMQPFKRRAIVEANVFSYEQPATANLSEWGNYYGYKEVSPKRKDEVTSVMVRDADGNTYPGQIIAGKVFPPGYRSVVQFVVNDMPAGGYKTFYIDTKSLGVLNDSIPYTDNTFNTDFYKIRIDKNTGNITSLIDKTTNKEYVEKGGELNTLRMYLESKNGEMKSWLINKSDKKVDIGNIVRPVKISNGPVRACIESERVWGKSKFVVRTYIYRSYPRIDYDLDVDWLETGSDSTDSPMLRAVFPIGMSKDSHFQCQVPFNVVERPHDNILNGKPAPVEQTDREDPGTVERRDGQEVPAQNFVDVSDGNNGFALMTKSKYGYCYDKGELRLTLLRSAGSPDLYPNLGRFNIQYAICPHSGDWTNGILEEGENFNVPVYAAEPRSTSLINSDASLPTENTLVSIDKANVLFSCIKKCEDENNKELIVRLCEMEGKSTMVKLKLPVKILSAERLNLIEYPLNGVEQPVINGDSMNVKLNGHEIVTLGIKFL